MLNCIIVWLGGVFSLIQTVLSDESESQIAQTVVFARDNLTNQINKFTLHQSFVQRVLAVASSSTSIVFCLGAMYAFLAIDPRRLVFRHQLISFLLFFDLVKAVILLLYPARVLTNYNAYYNERFCQIVGFFTAMAIEGADFAILAFAIHTFLLIIKPSLSVKVGNNGFMEGGLYIYRYYVYGLSFLIPVVLASLAYIKKEGYESLICWCYLPQRPVWYRQVLSWVPRYITIIVIITVYCVIYVHVIREFKVLGGMFTTMHKLKLQNASQGLSIPSFWSALTYFLKDVKDYLTPRLVLPDSKKGVVSENASKYGSKLQLPTGEEDVDTDDKNNDSNEPYGVDLENIIDDPDIQAANLENFKKRQKLIEKQMKSIFIYPFAYCFIWIFPFILSATQVNYEETHKPIYWLNCVSAFMQPFNGFVDSLVFFYRERPWEHTIMRNFEKENAMRMNDMMHNDNRYDIASVTTSARFKNSLTASFGVDIERYPKWRKCLSSLRFPLFKLPTDQNISSYQVKYIRKELESYDNTASIDDNRLKGELTHDFSNILNSDLLEKDFRSTFGSFSMGQGKGKTADYYSSNSASSGSGINQRKNSGVSSIRSPRSGRFSISDLNDHTIMERQCHKSILSDLSNKNVSASVLPTNFNPNLLSSYNSLKPKRDSGNISPYTPSTPKRTINKPPPASKTPRDTKKVCTESEMDFLDFLKMGP